MECETGGLRSWLPHGATGDVYAHVIMARVGQSP